VARPRHTDRRRLMLARDLLHRADAPLAGMVLVDRDAGGPRGYYSYGYSSSPNGEVDEPPRSELPSQPAVEPDEADVVHEADVLRDSPGG
jgi:hypothetical protein